MYHISFRKAKYLKEIFLPLICNNHTGFLAFRMFSAVCCGVWLELSNQKPIRGVVCILLNTNQGIQKDIRSGRDSAVVGIVGKSKSLDFPTMLIFWSLVRNSVVLAVYLLFSVACFLTVHEHCAGIVISISFQRLMTPHAPKPAPSATTKICRVSIAEGEKTHIG